jgi:DNA-binding IclR family transcriptional regulator
MCTCFAQRRESLRYSNKLAVLIALQKLHADRRLPVQLIADHADMSRSTATAALAELIGEGVIEVFGKRCKRYQVDYLAAKNMGYF